MSFASFIGDCEVIMPDSEPDRNNNKARIYLAKSALGSSGKNGKSSGDEGMIPHWAIVVHFYELDFWVEMGGVQSKGKLQGCYIKSKEEPDGKMYRLAHVTRLGIPVFLPNIHEIITSPYELHRIAKNHPYNGNTYDVLTMQCYEWAKIAARIIADRVEIVRDGDSCKIM